MIRAFRYRVYPSKAQKRLLSEQTETCRLLYNHLLTLSNESYKKDKTSLVSKFRELLPKLKKIEPRIKSVHSQVAQDVCGRLDFAFYNFFRRLKNGENPGFPRYKSGHKTVSLGFTNQNFRVMDDNRVFFNKIGLVKTKFHRDIPFGSVIKQATLKQISSGKFFVSIICEVTDSKKLPKTNKTIAFDLGLSSYLTTHEGIVVKNPKYLAKKLVELKKTQSKLDKEKKRSPKKDKLKKKFQKLHEKVKNQRTDHLHKLSRKIVNENDFIILEDLNIKNMFESDNEKLNNKQNKGMHRNIGDAAWSTFISMLSYKAEEAGRVVIKVDPRNTSKTCSGCGVLVPKTLRDRVHRCPSCGLVLDRDLNAARNIYRLGMQSEAVTSLPRSHQNL